MRRIQGLRIPIASLKGVTTLPLLHLHPDQKDRLLIPGLREGTFRITTVNHCIPKHTPAVLRVHHRKRNPSTAIAGELGGGNGPAQ
mmetsp:Transcript_26735/g.43993  ORF Transcript_26735/g.43993 Transcript_26735/m.43993 type:complete len:86 (-) Transcript_26735:681-938(-)